MASKAGAGTGQYLGSQILFFRSSASPYLWMVVSGMVAGGTAGCLKTIGATGKKRFQEIHVTTHPSEALVAKCAENLQAGFKPLIITLGDGVKGAAFLLKSPNLADRVDVLDIGQFLTANVYERSLFKTAACKVTFSTLLGRYNEIVAGCETDPALRIAIKADSK
jgi:hypothetical protein